MDPLAVATSVSGVAAMGTHLSQTIYALICTFRETEKNMSGIANDLSLLAMVLKELEGVVRRDCRVYRRCMMRVVNDMLNNCKALFRSISKHVAVNPQDTRSSEQYQRDIRWCFQPHRVRALQAWIESMKSTLDVLLHVVHVAKVTEADESFIPNACSGFKYADIQRESQILVGVVLENRQVILNFKQIEDRDRGQALRKDRRQVEGTIREVVLNDGASKTERIHGLPESLGSGELGPLRGWEGGSSADTSINTGLFSKDTKDSTTDTTCGHVWSLDDNKKDEKTSLYAGLGHGTSVSPGGEHEVDQAKESRARCNRDWDAFIATPEPKKKHLLDNLSSISHTIAIDVALGNKQGATDDFRSVRGIASFKNRKGKKRKDTKEQRQKEVEKSDQTLRDVSADFSILARSGSHSDHVTEVCQVLNASSSGVTSNDGIKHTSGADDLPSSSKSQEQSLSQSPASEYHSISSGDPTMDTTNSHHAKDGLVVKSSRPEITASAEGLAAKLSKSQPSPPASEIVTPTTQWFLSIVPHEPRVSAFIERSRLEEADYLRVRAEETAKTLLATWTNVDPDFVFDEANCKGWNSIADAGFHAHEQRIDEDVPQQSCQFSHTPPVYPMYAPQQWYTPPVITASSLLKEKKTDSEELTRLKKLILDEKAEQDARAALATAATSSIARNLREEVLEGAVMQRANVDMETVESAERPQEHNALLKAKPARRPPVIMRDWLGRKFIFPVDMCQTWEELHKLIQEAFGHVLEYRSMVDEGCYSISHITGEGILPSTWEFFVQPGLEINMEIWDTFDADRDELVGESMVGGRKDAAGPDLLQPPPPPLHLEDMPQLRNSVVVRSSSGSDPFVDDVIDDGAEYPFHGSSSHAEQSDHRYLSIENVLLEQKKATIEVQKKLERNRRFFQLKQQLIDQGAVIQARQDAAENAEQDTKLAWLEKQVRDQREELDRLPPLPTTPPTSRAGNLLRKSASSSERKAASFGSRLLGRMPSRSSRSKGPIRNQQMETEG